MISFMPGLAFSVFISLLVLSACDFRPEAEEKDSLEETGIYGSDPTKDHAPPVHQSYRLWHRIDQLDLSSFNYYSSFFDNRLKFFYTTDPGLTLGTSQVDMIMLYFLDNRLVKIRYHMEEDITEFLMDSLGLGDLKTRFNNHKKIYATRTNIDRFRDYERRNGNVGGYDIVWDRNIIYSTYKVDPTSSSLYAFDTIAAGYVYIDQLKSYRKRLIAIENELKLKAGLDQ